MGIDLTGLRALSFANRVYEFNFQNTVTLGRHEIHFWKQEFDAVRKNLPFKYDEALAVGSYCEPLLRALGADDVVSIDASAFEGASLVHDFNLAVSDDLHERFDTYLDFGSIEHIFNVAQVVDNIKNLVKIGGHILIATNANGFPAHGLYQYSPEFFYSVFSERNGFEDTAVFLVQPSRLKNWHLIKQPLALKRRNEIPFEKQSVVLVFSRKVRRVAKITVQQSDYDTAWTNFAAGDWTKWDKATIPGWKSILHRLASPFIFRNASYHYKSLLARRIYRADHIVIDPDAVDPTFFRNAVADTSPVASLQDKEMPPAEGAAQMH